MHLLYIVGPSSSGKSTLMAAATLHLPVLRESERPVPHRCHPGGIQLGRFPATDPVGVNVTDPAMRWLDMVRFPVVLGEGDKLANARFLEKMRWMGYKIQLVFLDASWELTQERRARAGGRQAPEHWLKIRHGKARNLAEKFPQWTLKLDAAEPVLSLALRVRQLPAFKYLEDSRQAWLRERERGHAAG